MPSAGLTSTAAEQDEKMMARRTDMAPGFIHPRHATPSSTRIGELFIAAVPEDLMLSHCHRCT